MEKNGNCSYPVGEKVARCGTARRGELFPHGTAQRNVRDPSVRLSINEGNETGPFFSGLCFPIASLDADDPHLEMGESGEGGGQAGHGPAGLRASWAG